MTEHHRRRMNAADKRNLNNLQGGYAVSQVYAPRMRLIQSIAFLAYALALRVNEWTAPNAEVRELRRAHRIRVMRGFESPRGGNGSTGRES